MNGENLLRARTQWVCLLARVRGNKKGPSIGLLGAFWYIFFSEPVFVLLMHHGDHSFSLQCGAGVFAFVPAETFSPLTPFLLVLL